MSWLPSRNCRSPYRSSIRHSKCCTAHPWGTPSESLACYDLINRLQSAGNEMEITLEDFKILKEKVERNTAQWVTFFHAQVLNQLQKDEGASNGK
jgi:hypothetical protein